MPEFSNRTEDGYQNPELIAGQCRAGRNAYFEVQLTLAEYASSVKSAGGGVVGDPTLISAQARGNTRGCPETEQFVWVWDREPYPVRAYELLSGEWMLYNPVTRNHNPLKSARLLENRALSRLTTRRTESIVSVSHQIIRNPSDEHGVPLILHNEGEILSFDRAELNGSPQWNIYQDVIVRVEPWGFGDVVEIEIENEHLYACGTSDESGTVAHNLKDATL